MTSIISPDWLLLFGIVQDLGEEKGVDQLHKTFIQVFSSEALNKSRSRMWINSARLSARIRRRSARIAISTHHLRARMPIGSHTMHFAAIEYERLFSLTGGARGLVNPHTRCLQRILGNLPRLNLRKRWRKASQQSHEVSMTADICRVTFVVWQTRLVHHHLIRDFPRALMPGRFHKPFEAEISCCPYRDGN